MRSCLYARPVAALAALAADGEAEDDVLLASSPKALSPIRTLPDYTLSNNLTASTSAFDTA